jgi:steroid delta-isomerase-like uncharacterized protein
LIPRAERSAGIDPVGDLQQPRANALEFSRAQGRCEIALDPLHEFQNGGKEPPSPGREMHHDCSRVLTAAPAFDIPAPLDLTEQLACGLTGDTAMMIHADVAAIEANRELGRRFFEEQDRLRGGPAEALCAPGYMALLGGSPAVNRAGHEGFARAFYTAFEDMKHDIQEVFATEDRVAVRFVLHGTHTGSFFGFPATERAVTVAANVILHLSGGKVTTLMGIFDEAGLLRQLGILNA